MLKAIRTAGTHDITQEQWQRHFGGVLTYPNLKHIILHTKRFVNPDGSTRPFISFNEFNTFFKTKQLIRDDNNLCLYIKLAAKQEKI